MARRATVPTRPPGRSGSGGASCRLTASTPCPAGSRAVPARSTWPPWGRRVRSWGDGVHRRDARAGVWTVSGVPRSRGGEPWPGFCLRHYVAGRLHVGPGGDLSWLAEHLGPNPMVDELVGRVGALLVGSRTLAAIRIGACPGRASPSVGDGAHRPGAHAAGDQPLVPPARVSGAGRPPTW